MRARDWYFAQPPLKFEAITVGIAVLAGLLLMPALIYLAGSLTLREYANGGFFALYADFYENLFELESAPWIVVAGPLGLLLLIRLFRLILRKL